MIWISGSIAIALAGMMVSAWAGYRFGITQSDRFVRIYVKEVKKALKAASKSRKN